MIDANWGQWAQNEFWETDNGVDAYGVGGPALSPIFQPSFNMAEYFPIIEPRLAFYETLDLAAAGQIYYQTGQTIAPQTGSPVDAINWGTVLAGASELGTLIIPVYFQPFAQNFVTDFWGEYDARDWTDHELGQFRIAFDMIESLMCNLSRFLPQKKRHFI